MFSLILAIIYIAFVSLGLPDSLLGSAWPVMYENLAVPVSYAGMISMIIAGGTIISSLLSDFLTRKLGTGLVTAISVLTTAIALFGFSISGSFLALCLWAVPYGLGAGAVDAALNNYVALYYSSRHMNWLHCFWGVGVSISPFIMGWSLTNGFGWNFGYRFVSIIQIVLSAILFLSLPLWNKKRDSEQSNEEIIPSDSTLLEKLRIPGVKYVLIAFFGYCALESTAGLWASSYLVLSKGIDAQTAARFASLFFLGITFGRFVSGFISDKVGDRNLIRAGLALIIVGIIAIWLPLGINFITLFGLVVIGFGCAPVYPSIIHETPSNFGKENSQAIIGIQMASAYTGSTFISPLFGLIAEHINIALYPAFLMIFAVLMVVMIEMLNRKQRKSNHMNL